MSDLRRAINDYDRSEHQSHEGSRLSEAAENVAEKIEALILESEHAEHTTYQDGGRNPHTHEPGDDLYCPACWVHNLRNALKGA